MKKIKRKGKRPSGGDDESASTAAPRLSWRKRETARARFVRIGDKRIKRVIRDLRLVANLASPNYEVREGDVTEIDKQLRAHVAKVIEKLRLRAKGVVIDEDDFSLASVIEDESTPGGKKDTKAA